MLVLTGLQPVDYNGPHTFLTSVCSLRVREEVEGGGRRKRREEERWRRKEEEEEGEGEVEEVEGRVTGEIDRAKGATNNLA